MKIIKFLALILLTTQPVYAQTLELDTEKVTVANQQIQKYQCKQAKLIRREAAKIKKESDALVARAEFIAMAQPLYTYDLQNLQSIQTNYSNQISRDEDENNRPDQGTLRNALTILEASIQPFENLSASGGGGFVDDPDSVDEFAQRMVDAWRNLQPIIDQIIPINNQLINFELDQRYFRPHAARNPAEYNTRLGNGAQALFQMRDYHRRMFNLLNAIKTSLTNVIPSESLHRNTYNTWQATKHFKLQVELLLGRAEDAMATGEFFRHWLDEHNDHLNGEQQDIPETAANLVPQIEQLLPMAQRACFLKPAARNCSGEECSLNPKDNIRDLEERIYIK